MVHAGRRSPPVRVTASAGPAWSGSSGSSGQLTLFFVGLAQRRNLVLEVSQGLKPPVDRGEAQICDLVQISERPKDRQAYLVRRISAQPRALIASSTHWAR